MATTSQRSSPSALVLLLCKLTPHCPSQYLPPVWSGLPCSDAHDRGTWPPDTRRCSTGRGGIRRTSSWEYRPRSGSPGWYRAWPTNNNGCIGRYNFVLHSHTAAKILVPDSLPTVHPDSCSNTRPGMTCTVHTDLARFSLG